MGAIMAVGVAVANAILLVTFAHRAHLRGFTRNESAVEGVCSRLRPILMTTLAFVAGMVPMMFAKGVGAAFNNATAGVILGGQTLSLLLTLLATPVFYSYFDDIIQWRQRRADKRSARLAAREAALTPVPHPASA
eukprot:gene11950-biopygen10090